MPSLLELKIDANRVMEAAELRSATVYGVVEKDGIVVAGLSSGHLVIWYSNGQYRRLRLGSAVYSLAFMNDDALVCGCDRCVHLYSWSSIIGLGDSLDKKIEPIKQWRVPGAAATQSGAQLPTAEANCVLWDRAKERLFIGAGDGAVYSWDPIGQTERIASVSKEMVLDIDLNQNTLAAACDDGSLAILDPRVNQAIQKTLWLAPTLNQACAFCTCLSIDATANWITAGGGIPEGPSSSSGALATFHISSGSIAHATKLEAPIRAMASRPNTDIFLATDIGLQIVDTWNSMTQSSTSTIRRPKSQFNPQVKSPATLALLDDTFCQNRLQSYDTFTAADLGFGVGGVGDLGPIPTLLLAGSPATHIDICSPERQLFSLHHDLPQAY